MTLTQRFWRNPVALAPMAGVTDVPFRALAWRLGVGYMVGEMTGSRPELAQTRKTRLRREAVAGAVHAVQIAGTEAHWMAAATQAAIAEGAAVVDINFGCPAKKVCRKAAGSALMAQPDTLVALAASAVTAAAAADGADVPVTVKMRTGPAPDQRNAPELALRLEAAGVAAIAVHGRTRACKFGGQAEFETVAEVKRRVSIPVFANGDIATPADAQRALQSTGADGVLIGRAALGAPWLPGWIAQHLVGVTAPPPSLGQRLDWLAEQVAATHGFYGPEQGQRIARKHIQWTLAHPSLPEVADSGERDELLVLSRALMRAPEAAEQLRMLSAAAPRLAA